MPRPFGGIGGSFGGSGSTTHTQLSTTQLSTHTAAPITLPTPHEELPVGVGLPSEIAPSDTSTGTFPPHVPAEMLHRSMPGRDSAAHRDSAATFACESILRGRSMPGRSRHVDDRLCRVPVHVCTPKWCR